MSFPDSYIFDLDRIRVDDIVRQLGNAVPPNFADALARQLLRVLVDKFEEDQQHFVLCMLRSFLLSFTLRLRFEMEVWGIMMVRADDRAISLMTWGQLL